MFPYRHCFVQSVRSIYKCLQSFHFPNEAWLLWLPSAPTNDQSERSNLVTWRHVSTNHKPAIKQHYRGWQRLRVLGHKCLRLRWSTFISTSFSNLRYNPWSDRLHFPMKMTGIVLSSLQRKLNSFIAQVLSRHDLLHLLPTEILRSAQILVCCQIIVTKILSRHRHTKGQ